MRSIDEVAELSYECFVETYGKVSGNYIPKPAQESSEIASTSSDVPKIQVSAEKEEKSQPLLQPLNSEDSTNEDVSSRKGSTSLVSVASSCDSGSDNRATATSRLTAGLPYKDGSIFSGHLYAKKEKTKSKIRKISMEKLSTIGGAIQAVMTTKRSKSLSFSDKSGVPKTKKDQKSPRWLRNVSPNFSRKPSVDSGSVSNDDLDARSVQSADGTLSSSVPSPLTIPASRIGICAHKGFLDCRNKKKHWERYWCVLQDSCLYCYHTPQSDITRDVILLRGYDVVADVTNLNRTRFIFRLEQQGFPTLHFSSDNHRDYLFWVGSLEKEMRSVLSNQFPSFADEYTSQRPKIKEEKQRLSLPDIERSEACKQLDDDLLKLQKEKLLKELALQKEQLVEEQKLLENLDAPQTKPSYPAPTMRKKSRADILDRYEKEKIRQELKTTEFLTFLNRRRNSCHLKMLQYTKDLAPNSAHRNKENHNYVAAMEKRLKEMQGALAIIDREFGEEEATKQHNMERLERKRDLELLIVEQREVIDLLRLNQDKTNRPRSCGTSGTPSSTRSRDTLGSIDELSDDLLTSSVASTSSGGNNADSTFSPDVEYPLLFHRSASDPCEEGSPTNVEGRDPIVSSDEDSGFQASNSTQNEEESYQFYHSVIKSFFPSPEHQISCDDPLLDDPQTDCFSSKQSTLKAPIQSSKPEIIDAKVMATIEDFELFAKLKLEEKKS